MNRDQGWNAAMPAVAEDLMEYAANVMFVTDRDGHILWTNAAFSRLTGYSRDEVLGKTPGLLASGQHGPTFYQDMWQTILAGRVWRGQLVNRRKDGTLYVDERTITPLRDSSGVVTGFLSVGEDITARREAERALRDSEERFRQLFDMAAVGMAEADPSDGRLLRVNARLCQITGYEADTLLTMSLPMLTYPEDRDKGTLSWQRLVRGEIPEQVIERRFLHKGGQVIWVQENAVVVHHGDQRPLRVLVAVTDLSACKRAEAESYRRDQELGQVFAALPDLYFRLAPDGTILDYRADDQDLPSRSVLQRPIQEVLPPVAGALFAQSIALQRTTGTPLTFEYQLPTPNGPGEYEARLVGVGSEGSGQQAIVALVRDITERKREEARRVTLEKQLLQAQKMEALGQLTGGIAHDFNNMLAAIMGYTQVALLRYALDRDTELTRCLQQVLAASERARDLVARMLTYSRVQVGNAATPLIPGPLVKEVTRMLSSTIPSGIELRTHIEERLPPVAIDPVELHQMLMNLAINARDAIGEHGHIDIGLRLRQGQGELCSMCGRPLAGSYVELQVADDGSGIAPEVLPRIFDPFFTTKEVGKGSGLGLSMVQGIIRKIHGHLLLHSSLGQGTDVRLLLPAVEPLPAEAPSISMPLRVAPPGQGRVWVVDDEPAVTGYLTEMLIAAGYRVTAFTDPVHALERFRSGPDEVDLVVTDQTMPHMSGAGLAEVLLDTRPDLPVILCTGFSERIDEQGAQRLGIRHFFRKPVAAEVLLMALAQELIH